VVDSAEDYTPIQRRRDPLARDWPLTAFAELSNAASTTAANAGQLSKTFDARDSRGAH
jgi:hypothetical protein